MIRRDAPGKDSMTTALFIGDSITDMCRRTDPCGFLGAGYVRRIAELAVEHGDPVRLVNSGVSGDRLTDLRKRWDADVLAHDPDILTVMVGVNDTWRRYDAGMTTTPERFESDYRAVLDATLAHRHLERLVIMEPFLVPLTDEQAGWRAEDLDAKIEVTRVIARDYSATLVPLDSLFTERAHADGALSVIDDGVHPSAGGHELIAQSWWMAVRA